ncbi:hypothetical protein NKG94_09955 [Micromonospora sp. M12]
MRSVNRIASLLLATALLVGGRWWSSRRSCAPWTARPRSTPPAGSTR